MSDWSGLDLEPVAAQGQDWAGIDLEPKALPERVKRGMEREKAMRAKARETERLRQTDAEPSLKEKASSAAASAWQGVMTGLLSVPEGVGRLAEGAEAIGAPEWVGQAGNFLVALAQEAQRDVPATDPRVEQSFLWGTVPSAFGSAGGFMLAGGAMGKVGMAATSALTEATTLYNETAGLLMPKVQSGEMTLDEAKQRAWAAFGIGLGLGATDAWSLERILSRADSVTGGGVRAVMRKAAMDALGEGAQEVLQTGGEQATLAWLADDERAWLDRISQVGEAGAAGGIVGAVLSLALSGAHTAAARAKARQMQREQEGAGGTAPVGGADPSTPGPLPTAVDPQAGQAEPLAAAAESGQTVTVTVPEGNLDGIPPGEVQGQILETDGETALVGPPEGQEGEARRVPVEWVQPADTQSEQTFLGQDAGPAAMPTDPGLFGEVERQSAAPEPAVGEAAAPTPSMFDEQEGDLPGQTSLIDLAGVEELATRREKKPTMTRSEAAQLQQTKMASGETTLRDFIAAHGGLAYTPELWDRFSRKETGARRPVGVGPVVHPKGSGRGMSLHDAITLAGESGLLFNPEGSYGVGHDEFLDALESDVTPLNAERIQREADEERRREMEGWDEPPAKASGGFPREIELGDPDRTPPSAQTRPPTDPTGVFQPIAPRMQGAATTATAMPIKGKPISAPQVQETFTKIIEAAGALVPFRIGRIKGRNVRGVFKVGPEVVRIREAGNIPTAAHEMGHALEKALYGWEQGGPWKAPLVSPAIQKELVALGKELYGETRPEGGYRREGWAEFTRLWLTENAKAKADAPKLSEWFETKFLPDNPQVAEAFSAASDAVRQWQVQGPRARAEASIEDPTSLRARAADAATTIKQTLSKQAWVEMGEPIRQFSEMAQERMDKPLKPKRDPWALYEALRLTHDARTERMVSEAMIDIAGNRVGPSLKQALAPVKGKRRDFTLYLWGRQAQLYWNDPKHKPRNPGLSKEDANALVAELRSPEFELAEGMLRGWHEGVLNYAAQASPAFANVVERVRASHPGYLMPLQRVFDDLDDIWTRAARRSAGQAGSRSPVKSMRGSGRRIKEPFQAMISNARAVVLKAHQRAVLDAVIGLSTIEGMGGLVERVPHDQVPAASRTIGELIEEINRKLDPVAGVSVSGVEGLDMDTLLGETLTFFAPAQQPHGQDPILPYWNGSSVDWYYVDGGLYRALSGMDIYRLPALVHWTLGATARTMRLGTTGINAAFSLVTNPMRDISTFWLNSQSPAIAPRLLSEWFKQFGRAAITAATGGKYDTPELRAWLDLGGSISQSLGQDIPHTRRAARQLFETKGQRIIDPRNWMDFLRDLFQFPESASRAAEVALVAKEIGWTPGTPLSLNQSLDLLRAGKRVTTDFTAAGEYGRVANQMIPFVNAAIQGPRAHLRAAQHHPSRFLFRGLQMAALTLGLWWQFKDEEWYKEMDPRERFGYWHFRLGDEIIRIPRPFEVGALFSAMPEALADAWYRADPERAVEWFKHMFEVITPPILPVPVEEAAEQLANRDFYTDIPIVPMSEQRRPAEEQYGEYTSKLSVFLGDVFSTSPRRIDHAIRGVFGGVGTDIVELLGLGATRAEREMEPSDAPVLGRLFMRGGSSPHRPQSVEKVWNKLEEYNLRQQSKRVEETPVERAIRLQLSDATKAIAALSWIRSRTPGAAERRKISMEILDIARSALEAESAQSIQRDRFAGLRKAAEAREAQASMSESKP